MPRLHPCLNLTGSITAQNYYVLEDPVNNHFRVSKAAYNFIVYSMVNELLDVARLQ